MNHGDHEVIIFDNTGQAIGVKPRRDVDKHHDIVHCVEVFVLTPGGNFLLSRILDRPTEVYAGKLAVPVATILRSGETSVAAARRALRDELFLENAEPEFLGKEFVTLSTGIKKWLEVYKVTADVDVSKFNDDRLQELVVRSFVEMNDVVAGGNCAGTLKYVWDKYREVLQGGIG